MVLKLIIEDNGGNRLVEANRGTLFCAPSSELENLGKEETERAPREEKNITREKVNQINLDLW